jgi:hypothetical protein
MKDNLPYIAIGLIHSHYIAADNDAKTMAFENC